MQGSGQVADIVQTEDMPGAVHLLKDIQTSRILPYAPDVVQIEAEKRADQDLVNNLMPGQGHSLTLVIGSNSRRV